MARTAECIQQYAGSDADLKRIVSELRSESASFEAPLSPAEIKAQTTRRTFSAIAMPRGSRGAAANSTDSVPRTGTATDTSRGSLGCDHISANEYFSGFS